MQKSRKVSLWMAALAMIGIGAGSAQASLHPVTARLAGTWDAKGNHTTGRYFVGHSTQIPTETLSYFVFNLDPVKGIHIQDAVINVPGSSDWAFTANWTGHPAGQTQFQFKQTEIPLSGRFTENDILNGMSNPANNWMIYHYQVTEPHLSYAWVADGLTHDFEITPFHGHRFPENLAKVQAAVNHGGDFLVFLVNGFGTNLRTEQYIYNGTGLPFNRPVVLTFNTN